MCHDISLDTQWRRNGARSAALCTQAILMAHFAGRREIGGIFFMRAALVDPKDTQHTTPKNENNNVPSPTSNRLYSTSVVKTNALGGLLLSGTAVLTDFLTKTPQKRQKWV